MCESNVLEKSTTISSTSNTLIINLNPFIIKNDSFEKINLKVRDLANTPLTINKSIYVLQSGIFHKGRDLTNAHYYTLHKFHDIWYKLDDTSITESAWPRLSEDAHMLFYEKV